MTKYALISVWDKCGIEHLAMELEKLGYTILSTSNTAKYLANFCPSLVQVSDLTGFPEILDGRVKTLHPVIHAGILADRSKPEHEHTLAEHGISHIDIVVVNLYPFAAVRKREHASQAEIIENIDIGGPTLIRAAAKNYAHVAVLTDPQDYPLALEQLKQNTCLNADFSSFLAQKAFAKVSAYDAGIADYFAQQSGVHQIPQEIALSCPLQSPLRYGENPHQQAGFYADKAPGWQVQHGKELSFNNLLDIDSALKAIRLFSEPTVIIIKHCNPCGIGSGESLSYAYQKAFATDTVAPFGGIVVVNRELDRETANLINKVFTEIIIAPAYAQGVLEMLQKKKDRRLIAYNPAELQKPLNTWEIKALQWGYLAQEWDLMAEPASAWKVVTQKQPTAQEQKALQFGWKAVSILKSNAIVLCSQDQVLGFGIGQTSRIDSTSLAIWKANKYGHHLRGSVCASDGFFPYRDTIDTIYAHGIKAVIQPGGSKGDDECIQACNELGITMIFTGFRHFRH